MTTTFDRTTHAGARGWAAAVILLGLLATTGQAQEGRTVLAVEVQLDSESYRTNLGSRAAELQDALERFLADKGEAQLAFLDWRAAADNPAGSGGTLRLRIREEAQAELGGLSRYVVEYQTVDQVRDEESGEVGEAITVLPPPLETVLFDGFEENFSTADGDRLQRRVEAVIEEHLRDTSFTDDLKKHCLFKIPLTAELLVEPPAQQFVVPLVLEDLQATKESVLRVEFTAPSGDGPNPEEKTGELHLKADSQIASGERSGFIIGLIELFSFPPSRLEPRQYWNATVADTLAQGRTTGIYMNHYDKLLIGLDGGGTGVGDGGDEEDNSGGGLVAVF